MKTRRLVAMFLVLVLAFSLVACGTTTETPTTATTPAAAETPNDTAAEVKDVTITVFHYMTQTTKQAGLDAVEAAFAAEHPEYNITWENIMYNRVPTTSPSCRPHWPPATSLRS